MDFFEAQERSRRRTRALIGVYILATLAVALAGGAHFVRVNVLMGVYATDQGMIEGQASEIVQYRQTIGSEAAIFADVHVKHAQPISQPDISLAAEEIAYRGHADVLIVSGSTTGRSADLEQVFTEAGWIARVDVWAFFEPTSLLTEVVDDGDHWGISPEPDGLQLTVFSVDEEVLFEPSRGAPAETMPPEAPASTSLLPMPAQDVGALVVAVADKTARYSCTACGSPGSLISLPRSTTTRWNSSTLCLKPNTAAKSSCMIVRATSRPRRTYR